MLHETLCKFGPQFSSCIHLHVSISQLLHVYAKQYFCNIRVIVVKILRLGIVPGLIYLVLQYNLAAFDIYFIKRRKIKYDQLFSLFFNVI